MAELFDFAELKRGREKFTIALAGSIYQSFYADDPGDPLTIQFDLDELAKEIHSLGAEEIDTDYRMTVAWCVTEPGGCIVSLTDAGLAENHAKALEWANDLIDKTQKNYRVRLLGWGRQ